MTFHQSLHILFWCQRPLKYFVCKWCVHCCQEANYLFRLTTGAKFQEHHCMPCCHKSPTKQLQDDRWLELLFSWCFSTEEEHLVNRQAPFSYSWLNNSKLLVVTFKIPLLVHVLVDCEHKKHPCRWSIIKKNIILSICQHQFNILDSTRARSHLSQAWALGYMCLLIVNWNILPVFCLVQNIILSIGHHLVHILIQ